MYIYQIVNWIYIYIYIWFSRKQVFSFSFSQAIINFMSGNYCVQWVEYSVDLTEFPKKTHPHTITSMMTLGHDDVIKWKLFPRYWPFVRGIRRSLVNSPHKGQWRGAVIFSLIYALNKRLSKQSWDWWFETPSRLSWRHYNERFSSLLALCEGNPRETSGFPYPRPNSTSHK